MLDFLEQYIFIHSDQERENLQIALHRWITRLLTILKSVRPHDELKQYICMDYPFLSLFFLAYKWSPYQFMDWVNSKQSIDVDTISTLQSHLSQKNMVISQLETDLKLNHDKCDDFQTQIDNLKDTYGYTQRQLMICEDHLKRETFKYHHCVETKSLLEKLFFVALKGYQASATPELAEQSLLNKLQHILTIQEEKLKEREKSSSEQMSYQVTCPPIITPPLETHTSLSSFPEQMPYQEQMSYQVTCPPIITPPLETPTTLSSSPEQISYQGLPPLETSSSLEQMSYEHAMITPPTYPLPLDRVGATITDTTSDLLTNLQSALQEEIYQLSRTQEELKIKTSAYFVLENEWKMCQLTLDAKELNIQQLIKENKELKSQNECFSTSLDRLKTSHQNQAKKLNKHIDLLKKEKQINGELQNSLKEDCTKQMQKILNKNIETIDILSTQNTRLRAEQEEDRRAFEEDKKVHDEFIKKYKYDLQTLFEEKEEIEKKCHHLQSQYLQLQEDTNDCLSLASSVHSIRPGILLKDVGPYIISLHQENEKSLADINELKHHFEVELAAVQELNDKCHYNEMMNDQLYQDKQMVDNQLKELNHLLEIRQQELDELSEKYNALIETKDTMGSEDASLNTINQLKETLETKNKIIDTYKTNQRQQERRKQLKQQFKSKDIFRINEGKLRLALNKCQLEKKNVEKELADLTVQYSQLLSQPPLVETPKPFSSESSIHPGAGTLTYCTHFLRYVEIILFRLKDVTTIEAFKVIYDEFAYYYHKFTTFTLADEWIPFSSILNTYKTNYEHILFEEFPSLTKTNLELSELDSLRSRLIEERQTYKQHASIITQLETLFSSSTLLDDLSRLTRLFKTPESFQKYLILYETYILSDSQLNYLKNIIKLLNTAYKESSLVLLYQNLKKSVDILNVFGGASFIDHLVTLWPYVSYTHDAMSYFVTMLEEKDGMVKLYNGLEVLRRVYEASSHKTFTSIKDMEKYYVISLLDSKVDYTAFDYNFKSTKQEPPSKKRHTDDTVDKKSPISYLQRRKKAKLPETM